MVNLVRSVGRVEVEIDGRVHEVKRPTVLQAVTILAAAENGEWHEAARVMGDWLGLRLSLLLRALGPESMPLLLTLLATGMPDRHTEEAKAVQKKAKASSWATIIAEHATAYKVSPEEVLRMPWPFFVLMHEEIDRQRAREQLRQWESMAGAQTGKIDAILNRADYQAEVDIPESMDDDWYERQLAAAKAFREARQKRGQA